MAARITAITPEEARAVFPQSAYSRRIRRAARRIHLTISATGRELLYVEGKQQPREGAGWKVKTIAGEGAQWPTNVGWTITIDGTRRLIVPLGTPQPGKISAIWAKDQFTNYFQCFIGGWAASIDTILRAHERLGVLEVFDETDEPLDEEHCTVGNLQLNQEVLDAAIDEFTRYERF